MNITISNDQRGLLFRKGNYIKLLMPGSYFFLPNHTVEVCSLTKPFVPSKDLALFLHDPLLSGELQIIEVKNNELAIHFEDEIITDVLLPGKYAYWKKLKKHTFLIVDTNNPFVDENIEKSILSKPLVDSFIQKITIESYENGLLFVNKTFKEKLKPGVYRYWKGSNEISIIKADLRQQQIDIAGQEIMSKDRITLRLNCVCHYKINDAVKVITEIKEYEKQLYIFVQLVLREYIGSLTLDEILEKKEEIGTFILSKIKVQAVSLGIEVIFTGIKDIILPGEIRDIINQVLIAEKKAQANVIMRREETASTRSLLNTARLMEENQVLYKLKELEYIERISEKISQIQLSNGSQLIDQLKNLFIPEGKK